MAYGSLAGLTWPRDCRQAVVLGFVETALWQGLIPRGETRCFAVVWLVALRRLHLSVRPAGWLACWPVDRA